MVLNKNLALFSSLSDLYAKAFSVLSKEIFIANVRS
jgi:hypothetical protein